MRRGTMQLIRMFIWSFLLKRERWGGWMDGGEGGRVRVRWWGTVGFGGFSEHVGGSGARQDGWCVWWLVCL